MPRQIKARATASLKGEIRLPGDKSISHRALMFAALAAGESQISGLGAGEDVRSLAALLQALGVAIKEESGGKWRVWGTGTGGLKAPRQMLDCGNSGTSARLMSGILAGHPFSSMLTGDSSLCQRPMRRITEVLAQSGAEFFPTPAGTLPMRIEGASPLLPCQWRLQKPSAQVKASLIFAALHASGTSRIEDPFSTRDHSELMLPAFGINPVISPLEGGGDAIEISAPAELTPASLTIAADPSAGAFPAAGAALLADSVVSLPNLCLNPRRFGFYDALKQMGAEIKIESRHTSGGEEIGAVEIHAPQKLRAIDIPADKAPAMIDEYPALAMTAAKAEGVSRFRGLGELRVKESDRFAALLEGLAANGVEARSEKDDIFIQGREVIPGGGEIDAKGDHRIAMSFAVLGLAAQNPITIKGAEVIATSFPDFVPAMKALGANIEIEG